MRSVYCTIITKSRLYQFLALVASLDKVKPRKYRFFVLCVEEETYDLLKRLNWSSVKVVHERELSPEVVALKKERKIHEYCWTLKATFLETILQQYPEVMRVTYMDSDLYFWRDPEMIFNNQPNCSVLLSNEEKYKPEWTEGYIKKVKRITGEYNSGFISFKRDNIGMACLKWWKEKTLEDCRIDRMKGIFGDQKYLDEMPKLFTNICDISTPGVNVGPWNYLKYTFGEKNKRVYIDKIPLIFYHFSGVRISRREGKLELVHNSKKNRPIVFDIYYEMINKMITMVQQVEPGFDGFASEEDLKSYW